MTRFKGCLCPDRVMRLAERISGAPVGLPESAIRATTSTCWPMLKLRPAIMESAAVSSTSCGKRLSSRFTASGGPRSPGARTKTNSGAEASRLALQRRIETDAHTHDRLIRRRCAELASEPASCASSAAIWRSQDRPDVLRRALREQRRESLARQRQIVAVQRSERAVVERLGISRDRSTGPLDAGALPVPRSLSRILQRQRFGKARERFHVAAVCEPVGALVRAYGQRELLQHDIGTPELATSHRDRPDCAPGDARAAPPWICGVISAAAGFQDQLLRASIDAGAAQHDNSTRREGRPGARGRSCASAQQWNDDRRRSARRATQPGSRRSASALRVLVDGCSSASTSFERWRMMRTAKAAPSSSNAKRQQPQPRIAQRESRAEEDELAVARHHEIADLLVRLAGEQHVPHLVAQIRCQAHRRIRDGLVLALHAAQLVRELL